MHIPRQPTAFIAYFQPQAVFAIGRPPTHDRDAVRRNPLTKAEHVIISGGLNNRVPTVPEVVFVHVVATQTAQRVVALVAGQRVIPRPPIKRIRTGPAIQPPTAVIQRKGERRRKRGADQRFQVQAVPARELQARAHAERCVLQRDRLAVVEGNMQRRAAVGHAQGIARGKPDRLVEPEGVVALCVVHGIQTGDVQIGVVACAAGQVVGPPSSDQRVVAPAADQDVVSDTAIQIIVAVVRRIDAIHIAFEIVIARAAQNHI